MASHDNFGTTKRADELRALFYANGGACVYTGRALTPGIDASLDHIIAISRGGVVDDLANVQWVHSAVNQMKWNFTEAEFFSWIAAIHAHRVAP